MAQVSSTKQFPRSATSSNLSSTSVPSHLRRLPRSASLVSIDNDDAGYRRPTEDNRGARLLPSSSMSSSNLRGSSPLSPRKPRGQFVWTPNDGFVSQRTINERAAPTSSHSYLPAGNAAERILQVLEDVETPLAEARKPQTGVPQLGELSRSFSLGRIHVPTATKEKEKEEKRREVMISPYGRTRQTTRERGMATSGSGLRRLIEQENGGQSMRRSTTDGSLSSLGRAREENRESRRRGRGEVEATAQKSGKKSSKKRNQSRDRDMMEEDEGESVPYRFNQLLLEADMVLVSFYPLDQSADQVKPSPRKTRKARTADDQDVKTSAYVFSQPFAYTCKTSADNSLI